MISLFCLTHRFKRGMLEISSEISYSELRDYLRPLQNKIFPDNVLFKIAFGKKRYDIIRLFQGGGEGFYSQKIVDILSQFVDMSDKCFPINIEGIEEKYYVINNLRAYPFWNRKEHTFMDDPYYFGIHDNNISIAGIEGTSVILVSEEIRNALVKNKISNISLIEAFGCSFEEYEKIKESNFKPQIHIYEDK